MVIQPHQVRTPEEAGQLLSERRKNLKRTIEAAGDDLHIPINQLLAIEEGDFSVFTAEVYARGVYVAYAKWLGIPREQAGRAVSRALSFKREERLPLKIYTPQKLLERLLNPRLVFLAASGLVVILIGGYIGWQLRSFWQLPKLKIISPEILVVNTSEVVIKGVAERNAQVVVNNTPALLDDEQMFAVKLRLHSGINVVRVEASNAAGRVRIARQDILRLRN